ncbi:tigger transposable element-derived protein [Pontoporia blainvillei]|uniref:Tigger transposable element-derived protein n=1 Tax=Pontoporia blainvillei TaxID=48723 RepID=A0ABX0S9Z3_PONBL|nr:tigger transposable element-derived protein [Pontoporia blainvillei]
MARGSGMKTTPHPQVLGKAPLGIGLRHSAKRDRKSITLHVKLEVLRRFEEGEKLTQIARALGLATSTVASIRVNKDKIRANSQAATPVSTTQLTRCRGVLMGHMERLLSLWIEEQKRQNLPVSTLLIQDKARRLFAQLQHEQGSGARAETFGASNGWFARFKPMNQGVIAAFKAHYLRRTLSQLVQETAGTDRPSVREFWRSYTVMTAVDNIAKAWAELQPATMNSAWRKLWPECIPAGAPKPNAVPQLRHSTVTVASHAGFGDVPEADVAHLLQAHGEPSPRSISQEVEVGDVSDSGLPCEAGRGLASRRPESDLMEAMVGVETEEVSVGALGPELLAQALSHFAAGLRVLIENDPNRERSLRVSRGVHCALAHLRELQRERRRQARAVAGPQGAP